MYSRLFRAVFLPFYESVLRRRPTLRHLAQLESQQWLSRDQVADLCWEKLRKMLRHTYEQVPYYRRQWDALGAHPEDIGSPADFRRFPLLTKTLIRQNQSDLVAGNYRRRRMTKSGTGGSTGEPLRFMYPHDAYEWRVAGAARADRWAGWDWACKEAWIWGLPPVPESRFVRWKKKLHHAINRRRIFNSYTFSDQTLPRVAAELTAYRPQIIIAYANPLYQLAQFALKEGLQLPRPRGIISTAEMLYDFQRETVEKAFDCRLFNRYGCREVALIACECAEHNGLHLNADNLYIELLREDGMPCAPGEVGYIVLTDLNNYGMPFIRYRIGDLGIPTDRVCPCGRGLPLMESVTGRTMDIIHLPDGRHLTGLFFTHILLLHDFQGLQSFQFEQTASDQVKLRIVRGPDWKGDDLEALQNLVKKHLGNSLTLSFEFVDKIPITHSGKWRPVIGLPSGKQQV